MTTQGNKLKKNSRKSQRSGTFSAQSNKSKPNSDRHQDSVMDRLDIMNSLNSEEIQNNNSMLSIYKYNNESGLNQSNQNALDELLKNNNESIVKSNANLITPERPKDTSVYFNEKPIKIIQMKKSGQNLDRLVSEASHDGYEPVTMEDISQKPFRPNTKIQNYKSMNTGMKASKYSNTNNSHSAMDYQSIRVDKEPPEWHNEFRLESNYKQLFADEDNRVEEENEEETTKLKSLKPEIKLKDRLLSLYMGDTIVNIMPKFMKEDYFEKKCKDILKFELSDAGKRTSKFWDPFPLLRLRFYYNKITTYFSDFCRLIVDNTYWDNFSLLIIISNSLIILFSNPLEENNANDLTDVYYLFTYTFEMFLKIFAFGFVFNEGSYLRDSWNVLDFLIITIGLITFTMEEVAKTNGGLGDTGSLEGLTGLRAFRILRPLRTVKKIAGLRSIMSTLFESMGALGDTVIVLMFFFLIFAIAAIQMWSGLLQKRCMDISFGYAYSFHNFTTMCTADSDCYLPTSINPGENGAFFVCAKVNVFPSNGLANVDIIYHALLVVFIIVTMEGWTDYFNFFSNTFKDDYYINAIIIFLWFHIFIFVGGYYLMNLFLAVVWSKFSEIEKLNNEKAPQTKGSLAELILQKEEKDRLKILAMREKKLTEDQKIEKKREKFTFIENDPSKIPIQYRTISDLLYLENLTPKETYYLKQNIAKEAKRAEKEFDEEVNSLRTNLEDESVPVETENKEDDNKPKNDDDFIPEHRQGENHCLYPKKKVEQRTIFMDCILTSIEISIEKWHVEQEKMDETQEEIEEEVEVEEEENDDESNDISSNELTSQNASFYSNNKSQGTMISDEKELNSIIDGLDNSCNYYKEIDKIHQKGSVFNKNEKEKERITNYLDARKTIGNEIIIDKPDLNLVQMIQKMEKGNKKKFGEDDTSNQSDIIKISSVLKAPFKNKIPMRSPMKTPKRPSLGNPRPSLGNPRPSFGNAKPSGFNPANKRGSILNIPSPLKRMSLLGSPVKRNSENVFGKQKRKSINSPMKILFKSPSPLKKRKKTALDVDFENLKLDSNFKLVNNPPMFKNFGFKSQKSGKISNNNGSSNNGNGTSNANGNTGIDGILEISENLSENFQVVDNSILEIDKSINMKYKDFDLDSDVINPHKVKKDHKYIVPSQVYKRKFSKANTFFYTNKREPDNISLKLSEIQGDHSRKNATKIIRTESNRNFQQLRRNPTKLMRAETTINKDLQEQLDKEQDYKNRSKSFENDKKYNEIELKRKEQGIEYVIKILKDDIEEENTFKKQLKLKFFGTPNTYRSYRLYNQLMNNLIEKDFSIDNEFKIDDKQDSQKIEILEKKEEESQKNEIEEELIKPPVKVFNEETNILSIEFVKQSRFEIALEDYLKENKTLTHITKKVYDLIPLKKKDYGMVETDKNAKKYDGAAEKSNLMASRREKRSTNTFNNSSMTSGLKHRSKLNILINYEQEKKNNEISALNDTEDFFMSAVRETFTGEKEEDDKRLNQKKFNAIFLNQDKFNEAMNEYLTFREEENRQKSKGKKKGEKEEKVKKKKVKKPKKELDEENIDTKNNCQKICKFDEETDSKMFCMWSAPNVLKELEDHCYLLRNNEVLLKLEDLDAILWKPGLYGRFQKFRHFMYCWSINQYFDFFVVFIVIFNAVLMALDGDTLPLATKKELFKMNYFFNAVFLLEFSVKILGLGPIIYFSDTFNYLDTLIVVFGILEMSPISGDKQDNDDNPLIKKEGLDISQLGILKIFRIFRVFRLAKVLRRVKAMRNIINGINKSISNILYTIGLLFLFILIFVLLGMSLFPQIEDMLNFWNALYVVFQTLTLENWNTLLALFYPKSGLIIILYLIIWIFVGNFILFNLFLSILLDSFNNKEEEDDELPFEKSKNFPDAFKKILDSEREINRPKDNNHKKHKEQKENSSSEEEESSEEEQEEEEEEKKQEEKYDDTEVVSVENLKKINKIYKNNECEYSVFIFQQINSFRIACITIAHDKRFENFILLLIVLSTLRLIIDTFINDSSSNVIFDSADLIFNFFFYVEFILKVIGEGFVMHEGTYLRDNWNKLDFLIVVVSTIDMQSIVDSFSGKTGGAEISFFKVLRLLRTLRPLRFISHNVQLKLIVRALLDSIEPIMNVLAIVFIVYIMYGIMGITLFSSNYHTCYQDSVTFGYPLAFPDFANILHAANYTGANETENTLFCQSLGGTMDKFPSFTFKNILESLVTCFVLSNMEGWPDISNEYRAYNNYYGLFYVLYLLTVSYFFFNLFIGVMFSCFHDAYTKEKRKGLKDNKVAEKWIDYLTQVDQTKPDWAEYLIPEEPIRLKIYNVVTSSTVDNFIMSIIVLNLLTMAMNFEAQSQLYELVLDWINIIFTGIFILEAIFKLLALGFTRYFQNNWNRFDFFVVVASIVDMSVTYSSSGGNNSQFLKSFQIIRVLRVLRVTRILRLVKSLKGLEKLIQTLKFSIGALGNILILMMLIFCIFAIAGCYLFSDLVYLEYRHKFSIVNEYYNTNNFYNSFLLTFRTASGESWPLIMKEYQNAAPNVVAPYVSQVYFMLMIFFCAVIMLNLFVLVVLQQYDEFHQKEDNPIERFSEMLDHMKKSWNKFTTVEDKGERINMIKVTQFLFELEGDLSLDFSEEKEKYPSAQQYERAVKEKIKLAINDLKFQSDAQGMIYYQDVLFKLLRRKFGNFVDSKGIVIHLNEKFSMIKKEEDKLLKIISDRNYYYFSKKMGKEGNGEKGFTTFNPLTSHLYYKISYQYFNLFIKTYHKEVIEKHPDLLDSENNSPKASTNRNFKQLETRKSKLDNFGIDDKIDELDENLENINENLTSREKNKFSSLVEPKLGLKENKDNIRDIEEINDEN